LLDYYWRLERLKALYDLERWEELKRELLDLAEGLDDAVKLSRECGEMMEKRLKKLRKVDEQWLNFGQA